MVLREKLYTVEEFRKIALLPENEGKFLELTDGVIYEIPQSRPIESIISGRISYFLNANVIPKNLGWITNLGCEFKLQPDRSRQPDVAFVSKSQADSIPDEFNFAPALAVEVVSPSEDVFKKVNEYLDAGTNIVWAVYCDDRKVYVFTRNESGILHTKTKNINDILDGGDVLPEFKLPVKDIFPPNMPT